MFVCFGGSCEGEGLSHLKVFFLSFFCVCVGGGGGGDLPLSMTHWSSLHVAFVYVLVFSQCRVGETAAPGTD